MALIHCDFFSRVLGSATSMCVILPEPASSQDEFTTVADYHKHPTLYLLHGLSDDHTTWQRRTSIERYVASIDLAVVMPAMHRSVYADMAHGYRYWTFISEELPALAQSFFPLSDVREENFVVGLSMGGYGAFKLALTYPDRYVAAASLSGTLDFTRVVNEQEKRWRVGIRKIFGASLPIAERRNDLFWLAKQMVKSEKVQPLLYQWCGTEDSLYRDNLRFQAYAKSVGLALTYEESPGTHEWQYWDQQIQRVLAWLPLRR
jgi:putative tributyrin esterase